MQTALAAEELGLAPVEAAIDDFREQNRAPPELFGARRCLHLIELPCDRAELGLAMQGQIGATWKILAQGYLVSRRQFKRRMTTSDTATLFPNNLQPAAALNILQPPAPLKAYEPTGIKFWENQETVLEGLNQFAEGWFARRHKGVQMAIEAAKNIGEADSGVDILREYQSWLIREMELLAEDGKAYQQQVLRAGAQLRAQAEEEQQALNAAAHPNAGREEQEVASAAALPSARSEAPQTGKRRTG